VIVLEKYYRLASWFAIVGIVVLRGAGLPAQSHQSREGEREKAVKLSGKQVLSTAP
jgi:hypothetical protein